MFGFLKNLLGRRTEAPAENVDSAEPAVPLPPPPPAIAPARSGSNTALLRRNGNGIRVSTFTPPPGDHAPAPVQKGVQLPLQAILHDLPLELQPLVSNPDVGDLMIAVPLERILAQLSRGVVKMSFGELRQAVPQVFSPENTRDRVLVPLPLAEILGRLNPALIARRRVQRRVVVPAEIGNLFDPSRQGLIYAVGPETAAAASAPAAKSPRSVTPAGPIIAKTPARGSMSSAPTPAPPEAMPPPAPDLTPASRALDDRKPQAPPASAHRPAPVSHGVPAAVPPKAAEGSSPLIVPLTALAESWPEPIRKEIVGSGLVDAKVALPLEVVERALKQGRIAFSWKSLRGYLKPMPAPTASPQDGTVLELPLKVIAPLFLSRQREHYKAPQKVDIDEDIPNLFFGFPQPDSAPAGAEAALPAAAPPGKPADSNYYVWGDTIDTVTLHESEVKRGPSVGTRFITKFASPNEIVSRAAALDGVAGALIALPDGLMVASKLSPDLNGETLAAFLPQIFGKVSACTKELRMGELNNLNFTVGNTPWKVFRVNAIFFAAFGRAGEGLPTAQLAALAAELDHKPK